MAVLVLAAVPGPVVVLVPGAVPGPVVVLVPAAVPGPVGVSTDLKKGFTTDVLNGILGWYTEECEVVGGDTADMLQKTFKDMLDLLSDSSPPHWSVNPTMLLPLWSEMSRSVTNPYIGL